MSRVRLQWINWLEQIRTNQILDTKFFDNGCITVCNDDLDLFGFILLAQGLMYNNTIVNVHIRQSLGYNICAIEFAKVLTCNKTIQRFDIDGNRISYIGIKEILEALKMNKTLKTFKITGCTGNNIRYSSAIEFSKMLSINTGLTNISLENCKIGNKSLDALAIGLHHNTTLKSLNLYSNKIRAYGIISLFEALQKNKSLVKLNLCGNYFGVSGCIEIAKRLNFTIIEDLNICGCNIRDNGAQVLANVLKENITIKQLIIGNNNFTDVGKIAILETLKVNKTLKCVRGDDNSSKDFVDTLIHVFKTNTTLEELYMFDIKYNNKQIDLISDALEENRILINFSNTSILSFGKIVSRLSKNLVTFLLFQIRNNKVLSILPGDVWRLICSYLTYNDMLNFKYALTIE